MQQLSFKCNLLNLMCILALFSLFCLSALSPHPTPQNHRTAHVLIYQVTFSQENSPSF